MDVQPASDDTARPVVTPVWTLGTKHSTYGGGMTDDEYWAYVDHVARKAPPITAAQCEVLTRILAPKGWEFIPKEAPALLAVKPIPPLSESTKVS